MRRILLLGALALLVSSCIPVSKNPAGDAKAAKADARLTGVWQFANEEGEVAYIHFVPRADGHFDVVLIGYEPKGADLSVFTAIASKHGDNNVLSLRNKKEEAADFMLARYEVSATEFRVGLLETAPTREAIEQKRLAGEIDASATPPSLRITATTDELGAFFAKPDATKMFEPLKTMKKVAGPK